MKRALFIFRRDLRLQDNRGLFSALKAADEVILSFIFNPDQIENNSYRSTPCLQFMIESLEELESEISNHCGKLYLFYGEPENIVEKCIIKLGVEGVFVNEDYTPYSIQRDKKIQTVCAKHSVLFQAEPDLLLHPIKETLKADGKPYTVFTPFFRHASKFEVSKPQENRYKNYFSGVIDFSQENSIYKKIIDKRREQVPGGRKAGLKILQNLASFSNYPLERDFPAQDKTTHLSAHLKFTTCSVREVYYAIFEHLGPLSELIRSLYWRDFFSLITLHFPHVFFGAFKTQYDHIKWDTNEKKFQLWCDGQTGFPIVDAGMRELNETGFMHNRLRMITASFLIKDLHINWQWGEKYFAQRLLDYDPAVNNGNWQWCASTGCDAQPYFRIFNPWSQGKKFDLNCEYIKKWIPELQNIPSNTVHNWYLPENYRSYTNYPAPIIEHSIEAPIALNSYKMASSV